MGWKIIIPTKVGKKILKLPKSAQSAVLLLVRDLERYGPATGGGWKNYSKLQGMSQDKRHCHLRGLDKITFTFGAQIGIRLTCSD